MSFTIRKSLMAFSLSLLVSMQTQAKMENDLVQPKAPTNPCPITWDFSGTLKTGDTLYGKNISWINSCEKEDRILRMRHTLDLNAALTYADLAKSKFSIRNRAVWGSPNIAPTTTASTKILDAVGQDHKHYLPRQIFWMREAWLELSLNKALSLSFLDKKQTLTLGAFSFALGRGIALGNAYAISPDYLGFYSDSAVDQYAFGIKFSGELVDKKLSYDLYGAILDNQSFSLSKTGQKILGQEYGKLKNPERGYGKVNYVVAGRLNYTALDNECNGKLTFEPYFLVNDDPEQQVEFLGDASSRLGTIGLAQEYVSDRFEFGFDTALNFGYQQVKGWDRNVIEAVNKNGQVQLVNSHVYVNSNPTFGTQPANPSSAYKVPYVGTGINAGVISTAGSTAQGLINNGLRAETQNGVNIGNAAGLTAITTVPSVPATQTTTNTDDLFNAINRFRDPYKNKYKGWMLVTDAAYFLQDRDIRLAATAAYVSGDQDPNSELKDGDYRGFIGLQELYAGKRVKSAFFLSGSGKISRPLDIPATETQPDRLAAIASGFTNLKLLGAGITWEPNDWEKSFSINPNILVFWQTYPDKAFDQTTGTVLNTPSNSFLGIEANLFVKKELFKCLQLFATASVFIPGSHYNDVKGKPMNATQWKILDRMDRTGYNADAAPGLGTDISYTFNLGLEYKF